MVKFLGARLHLTCLYIHLNISEGEILVDKTISLQNFTTPVAFKWALNISVQFDLFEFFFCVIDNEHKIVYLRILCKYLSYSFIYFAKLSYFLKLSCKILPISSLESQKQYNRLLAISAYHVKDPNAFHNRTLRFVFFFF